MTMLLTGHQMMGSDSWHIAQRLATHVRNLEGLAMGLRCALGWHASTRFENQDPIQQAEIDCHC